MPPSSRRCCSSSWPRTGRCARQTRWPRRRASSRSPPTWRTPRDRSISQGFLDAELSSIREERRGVIDAAKALAASEARSSDGDSAARVHPARGVAATGGLAHASGTTTSVSTSVGPIVTAGARRRWHRRTPLLMALVAAVVAVIAWPRHRVPDHASVVPFVVGHAGLWSGGSQNCALRGDRLACWGNNSRGQLGDGTLDTHGAPVMVPVTGIRDAAMGEVHTCASPTTAMSGAGAATSAASSVPVAEPEPGGAEVPGVTGAEAIVAGRQHACALLAGGVVSCWGANESGQLGRPPSTGQRHRRRLRACRGHGESSPAARTPARPRPTGACCAGAPTTAGNSATTVPTRAPRRAGARRRRHGQCHHRQQHPGGQEGPRHEQQRGLHLRRARQRRACVVLGQTTRASSATGRARTARGPRWCRGSAMRSRSRPAICTHARCAVGSRLVLGAQRVRRNRRRDDGAAGHPPRPRRRAFR